MTEKLTAFLKTAHDDFLPDGGLVELLMAAEVQVVQDDLESRSADELRDLAEGAKHLLTLVWAELAEREED